MIRYAIVGAGRMGNAHAAHLAKLDNAEVAVAFDVRPEVAKAFAERHGCRVAASLSECVSADDVDCVIVTSPTYAHPEAVFAAMDAGKAIFCEKALCRTPEDADLMLARSRDYQPLVTVGFVRRHMLKTLLVRRLLAEGLIGRLRYCNVDLPLGKYARLPGDWFADFHLCGGVIVDMLAHHIDLANWFFGPAARVYADSMLLTRDQPKPSDYVASVVTHQSGVIVNMMCSWQRFGRSGEVMEIYGDKGALVLSSEPTVEYIPADGEPRVLDPAAEATPADLAALGVDQVNIGDGFQREFANLTAALEGQAIELPTLQDAYNSLQVSFAMIESTRRRQAVELPCAK